MAILITPLILEISRPPLCLRTLDSTPLSLKILYIHQHCTARGADGVRIAVILHFRQRRQSLIRMDAPTGNALRFKLQRGCVPMALRVSVLITRVLSSIRRSPPAGDMAMGTAMAAVMDTVTRKWPHME